MSAAGAGLLKAGENGRGIGSCWYPETLANRIRKVASLRDKITFIHGDGLQVLRDHSSRTDAAFFIDPPYTAHGKSAGRRMYTHWPLDHPELFRVAASLCSTFLMTYDDNQAVRELADTHGFQVRSISMRGNKLKETSELLISRDLSWYT
jgi:DNA adenine methylase